ncbi:MAG: TonB-dependent vitamin B12 receptor [Plesiomonas sp.]
MNNTNPTLLAGAITAALFSGTTTAENRTTEDGSPIIVITSANRFAQPVSSVLAPIEVVTQQEITRWQVTSVTEALRRLPGVQISQNGGMGQKSSVFIRGTESKHVLILIDGIRFSQAADLTGSVDFSQIPLALVQRIEYIRGPRSSTYGADAIGGVINIITGRETDGGNLQSSFGSRGYQNYQGSIRQELSDNTRISLAGEFAETKGYDVVAGYPQFGSAAETDRDGFRSRFGWASLEHNFSDTTSAFARAYITANHSDYDSGIPAPGRDYYPNQNRYYTRQYDTGVRYQKDNYSSQLLGSYQNTDSHSYGVNVIAKNERQASYNQATVQWMNNYQLSHGQISAGVDWNRNEIEPAKTGLAPGQQVDNTGIYLTTQQKFGDWTVEGAVRQDHNQDYGNNFTWQSGIGWQFIDSTQAILSYGTAFKAPTLGQLYGAGSTKGNPDLKPESARNLELALSGHIQTLNWRVSGYRNEIDNLIDYDKNQYKNVEQATIKGIEAQASFFTAGFQHTISYDYLDPTRTNGKQKTQLPRRAKQNVRYALDFAIEQAQFDIAYNYVGKRYDDYTNKRELPSYSLWDLAASYPITQSFTARGRIANLFDKKYETAYGYPAAERAYYLTLSYDF